MEVECEKCGDTCEVEEAKPGKHFAWCDGCDDYAVTERNFDAEILADAIARAKDEHDDRMMRNNLYGDEW